MTHAAAHLASLAAVVAVYGGEGDGKATYRRNGQGVGIEITAATAPASCTAWAASGLILDFDAYFFRLAAGSLVEGEGETPFRPADGDTIVRVEGVWMRTYKVLPPAANAQCHAPCDTAGHVVDVHAKLVKETPAPV